MTRFVALALAVLALSGCGGDDDRDSEAGGRSQPGAADEAQTMVEESGRTTSESAVEEDTPGRDDAPGRDEADVDESSDPKAPSRAEYIRAADRICRETQAAIARRSAEYRDLLNDLARGKIKRQEYLRRGGALSEGSGEIAQRAVVELKQLPLPTSRRAAIETYLRGATEQAGLLTRQGRALREGRVNEVGELDRRVGQANGKTRRAARGVGFRTCGGGRS